MQKTTVLLAALALTAAPAAAADPALHEVNAARAARGLPPFQEDPALTAGAMAVADFRAARMIPGHAPNDFAFLPPGTSADAGGCAAWPQGMGWGACCTYDSYQFAGAAVSVGPDDKRYMHLFVRGGSGARAGGVAAPPTRFAPPAGRRRR